MLRVVSHWWRFARFLWPYRRQVVLSLICGALAAALWGLELLLTFPVVTVFVEGQSLNGYALEQVELAEAKLQAGRSRLNEIGAALQLLDNRTDERSVDKRLRLLREQSHVERQLHALTWRLWWLNWTSTHVLARLPRQPFHLILLLFGLLIVTTLVKGLSSVAQDVLASGVAELCVIDLRSAMFRRLLHRDPPSIELAGPPRLLSALTYDLQGLAQGLTLLGGRVVREPFKGLACVMAAFSLNWQLVTPCTACSTRWPASTGFWKKRLHTPGWCRRSGCRGRAAESFTAGTANFTGIRSRSCASTR
jgi:subfamily B ATP-binding cassette protein MsbA